MFKAHTPPGRPVGRLGMAILILTATSPASAQLIFRGSFESAPDDGLRAIVAWQDDRDNNGAYQIRSQGLTVDGSAFLADFTVNTVAAGQQINPQMAMAADGGFVVVWEDDVNSGDYYEVYARGFNPDGSERFATLTVNVATAGQQRFPDVAMAANGDFVVVWEDDQDGNQLYQIRGRGFDIDGNPRFGTITINGVGAGNQVNPAIGMAADGRFAVSWSDDSDGNGFYQIRARGFSASGGERFDDITVNTQGAGQQLGSDLAMAADGRFVVSWEDDQQNDYSYRIFARGFHANGSQRFADIDVSGAGAGSQYQPAIAMAGDGDFVISWMDQDHQVMARGFAADGGERFAEQVLNDDTLFPQQRPAVAVASDGSVVLVWEALGAGGFYTLQGRPLGVTGTPGGVFSVSSATSGIQGAAAVVAQ